MTGVSEDIKEECHSAMLNEKFNISRLMVHVRRVQKATTKTKTTDAKRERSFEGGSSINMLEIKDKPRYKKRTSNQVLSKFPKARDDKIHVPRSQR